MKIALALLGAAGLGYLAYIVVERGNFTATKVSDANPYSPSNSVNGSGGYVAPAQGFD